LELSPEATLAAAFEAVRRLDGAALIDLATPESVAHYRRAQRSWLMPPERHPRAADLQRAQPGLPAAAAEYQAAEFERASAQRQRGGLAQFGVASVEEFDLLDVSTVVTKGMARFPTEVREHVTCHPLGHVLEAQERAHVLFRVGLGSGAMPGSPQVATLELIHGTWRLALNSYARDMPLPGFANMQFEGERRGTAGGGAAA